MRTSEERINELHRRMDALNRQRSRRRYRLQCAVACIACLTITSVLALVVAETSIQSPSSVSEGMTASIFADREALGYVTVALMAFCLGALVTIFCFRLRKHMEEKDDARKQ